MTQIDITGPDGNAFSLIGYAKNFAKQLDMDGSAITKEMMAGDYDHLLDIFENHHIQILFNPFKKYLAFLK